MSKPNGEVQGEGDYKAARRYDEETHKFVEDGKVDAAVAKAKPTSPADEKAMKDAEKAGKARAKEEDPEVKRPTAKP
jgi:hypothetical protein